MLLLWWWVVVLLPVSLALPSLNRHIDLHNYNWTLTGTNGAGEPIECAATVPGDVYSDLYAAGVIGDPLQARHDTDYTWVADRDWLYTTIVTVDGMSAQSPVSRVLVQMGLDTVSETYINDRLVSNSSNMWHEHFVELKWYLRPDAPNNISILFRSPTQYAAQQMQDFLTANGYTIPPEGPPPVQRGRDHVNFVRKTQSSFSWDWGPSIPTSGVWRAISLELTDSCFWHRATGVPTLDADDNSSTWRVHVDATLYCTHNMPRDAVANIVVAVPELNISHAYRVSLNAQLNTFHRSFEVPNAMVDRWWPRGYGSQKRYQMIVSFHPSGYGVHGRSTHWSYESAIAFRTVELVQELIPGFDYDNGLTYYFRINRVPIFLKGTNWIPSSPFLAASDMPDRLRFLFSSMATANMNAMRLWGGGVYESDQFYDLADEFGVMIWHDLMFACALYPADESYLDSVATELKHQFRFPFSISRIRHHPSIVIWAGNNENELGLQGGWYYSQYPMASHSEYQQQYLDLYWHTCWAVVNETDYYSRPYVLSSPSDGDETVRQGGIAITISPASDRFGDMHVYNYYGDAWRPTTFPVPRCVTEYGYQSYPAGQTLQSALGKDAEWAYFSLDVLHRQHHMWGNLQMLGQVFGHFLLPSSANATEAQRVSCRSGPQPRRSHGTGGGGPIRHDFMTAMTFLTQAHQAVAYQTETEHYRRLRNRTLSDGKGGCMCALYWQLQDIWAAPTWASVDSDLHWKMAHYYARRFFAPVILSLYIDHASPVLQLKLAIVSDLVEEAQADGPLVIEALDWQANVVWSMNAGQPQIAPGSSSDYVSVLLVDLPQSIDDLTVRASLQLKQPITVPEAILLPEKLYRNTNYGRVNVTNIRLSDIDSRSFVVYLAAQGVAPFVWLETPLRGNFSDNAFTVTRAQAKTTFSCWQSETGCSLSRFRSTLNVTTLADLY